MNSKLIKELTPEQEAKIPEYVAKGLKYGLGTEPLDKPAIEEAARNLFKAYGKECKRIYYGRSPLEGLRIMQLLEEDKEITQAAMDAITKPKWNNNFMWGSQELYWLYNHQFINNELPVKKTDLPLDETIALCEKTGWFWILDDGLVITEKPCEYHAVDGRTHRTDGPAIKYTDGFGVYVLNGILMTGLEDLIHSLDPKGILNVKNVEQRAELIKLLGPEKLREEIAEKIDEGYIDGSTVNEKGQIVPHKFYYGLYRVSIYPDMPRIALSMINPSVPTEEPFEWVHPDCKTIQQANYWRYTGKTELPKEGYQHPGLLT